MKNVHFESNPLLTLPQVADMLQLSLSTVRNYIYSQQLPAYRVCGKRVLRVYKADAENLLMLHPRSHK